MHALWDRNQPALEQLVTAALQQEAVLAGVLEDDVLENELALGDCPRIVRIDLCLRRTDVLRVGTVFVQEDQPEADRDGAGDLRQGDVGAELRHGTRERPRRQRREPALDEGLAGGWVSPDPVTQHHGECLGCRGPAVVRRVGHGHEPLSASSGDD